MRERRSLVLYAGAVAGAGVALLAVRALSGGTDLISLIEADPAPFVIFSAFLVAGEMLPIRLPRSDGELTVSTTFAATLLITFGPLAAMVVQAFASICADVAGRKGPLRTAFNVGQYSLSWAAAGAVLTATSQVPAIAAPHFEPGDLGAIILASLVFFALNYPLATAAPALAEGERVSTAIGRDLPFQASTAAMLLGLAPVVAVVADFDLVLIPLLAFPLAAIYRGGVQARVNAHQALHDSLTGLPNRALFRDRVEQAVLAARRDGFSVAVLTLDLDRFKEINDTLGHAHGDGLLIEIGPRLREALRESDTVARLGSDEFAVLLRKVEAPAAAEEVAQRLGSALTGVLPVEGVMLDISASIGIACFPEHADDADSLVQRADVAMYVAKANHTEIEIYSPARDERSPHRLSLASELRMAIEAGELDLHYQPKIELASGLVTGVEALVRWEHPDRGPIPPADFVPIAEHTGLIKPLTMYVLERALGQCRSWRESGFDFDVAVNLSARNLHDRGLPADVAGLLSGAGLSPESLILEITESTIMADPGRSRSILLELDAMGVRLAIDDFGTGYSSLAYLKRLPVSELKIDRSFVMNMTVDSSDAVIVQSTVDLGRNLGLSLVAEGVETEAVWDLLVEAGCDQAQGYYMSRPLPADQLIRWATGAPEGARHTFACTVDRERASRKLLAPAP